MEYQRTIDHQNKIIQDLLKERHKEIRKINEYQNYLKSLYHNISFEELCVDEGNILMDYSTYIKAFCKKSSQYNILLFFLQRYEKMKRSLSHLSKKYRKEKRLWKEYINRELNKKTEVFELSKNENSSLKGKIFSDKENIQNPFLLSSINSIDSSLSKASLRTPELLKMASSLEIDTSPSSSALSDYLEECVLDNQKNTSITQYPYYNDSTTEDENEILKLSQDSKDRNSKINDLEINRKKEKPILFEPLICNNTLEIKDNSSHIKRDKDNFLRYFSVKNTQIPKNTVENCYTKPLLIDKKNAISHISNFLLTFKTNTKSLCQNNKPSYEKDKDENIPFKIISISNEPQSSIFNITQLLVDETNDVLKKNNASIDISNLTSESLKKKNSLSQMKPFKNKEVLHDNTVIKKDSYDIKTSLKRRFSTEYDENKKLHKNSKFICNLNSNTKGLGRYSRAFKSTEKCLDDYIINLDRNNNIPYAYDEVVRGKESRKHLLACACDNCIKFFEAHGPIATIPKPKWRSPSKEKVHLESNRKHIYENLQQVSRHRAAFFRAKTPPGFWESDFPNTQQEQEYRKQAEIQNRERLKERELEAERGGRWKKRL
ncbi:hypothetical protein PMAC_002913 [Pneumocystis sp. 'macacae']|nr:hypothetical protein PMAC_002913 [Pneumocystis sp. 'macacae']